MTLDVRIPEAVMVSDASPKGWGVTLELQTGDTLVQHGEWNIEKKRWIRNNIEMEAVYLQSRLNTGSGSEENCQAMSLTENTNADSTYFKSIKQDNRCSKWTKQTVRIYSKERDIHSPLPCVGENINSGPVRNMGKQTRGQIRNNRRGRGRGRMVERIFEIMEGGDLSGPSTNSENWKNTDHLGKVKKQVDHDSIMVLRSSIDHTHTNRQQQIPYSWRELSVSEPEEGDDEKERHLIFQKNRDIFHGPRVIQRRKLITEFLDNVNVTRETEQMIIEVQKYNTQKKKLQKIGVFDDWMKEKNYTIEYIMNKNISLTHTKFMTQLTRTKKTKQLLAKHHASLNNTMLSFLF
ncbi:MAG: hypothetical protein EZS28_000932 [Streblomastix strix]|uniref:Uncharacterized protein n=1 Tax=Streblomastix strix TaxID=222440 RepID=A0A5J4X9G9_9EUKA|nr:MAG: hypothetical protein EZS28_000932 [Streblomastix strix]